jgi:L-ascorbate metabolism protein UlaG (beta-lactamase superfamily)
MHARIRDALAVTVVALVAACAAPCAPVATTAPSGTAARTEVVWLGQAAFKITTPGGEVIVWRNPATNKDETRPGGEPIGWIIELESGFRIYHAGDTAVFGDMRLIGDRFKPDLALVPIGGNFTMDPAEAAWAVKELLHPKTVIPMHYGTNPLARGTAQEFVDAMGSSAARVVVAAPGQAIAF